GAAEPCGAGPAAARGPGATGRDGRYRARGRVTPGRSHRLRWAGPLTSRTASVAGTSRRSRSASPRNQWWLAQRTKTISTGPSVLVQEPRGSTVQGSAHSGQSYSKVVLLSAGDMYVRHDRAVTY